MNPPAVSAPQRAVPVGACDAHTHVFDRRFSAGASPYALPDADLDAHAAMRRTLGAPRAVIVQPGPYATDPTCLLDALTRDAHALRGIMIADETVTDATLEAWHAAGVRGLRFVEIPAPGGTGRYPGSVGVDALHTLAPRLRALGWQAHLWAKAPRTAELLPALVALRVPIVLDHFAMPQGNDDPAFGTILNHLRDGTIWVKATLCRVAAHGSYDTLRPLHDALLAANADRVLWGSDWPYVRMEPAPDAGAMLDIFVDWVGDALAHRILVKNPGALFGFDA